MITKYQWLLKFIQPALGGLDKFYIIIYTFLYMIITKNQWFLKIILPASGGLEFYGIHRGFSIVVIPPEAGWIFMAFTAESQLFLPRLRWGKNIWHSLQNLSYNHPTRGRVDFFKNIVDILKVQKSHL